MTKNAAKQDGSPADNKITLKTVLWGAVGAVVLYQVYILIQIGIAFGAAATGPFGATLAVADEMGARFPTYFTLLQKVVVLPIPNLAAKKYYEDHLELFMEAARNFEVHPYWFTHNEATENMTFREVTTERIRAMYRQFEESGRMDYRIEKDRCAQFEFFRRNNIPHPKIQKTWYSKEKLIDDVNSGAVVEIMEKWPIFFKACHLTQRSSQGTFALASPEKFQENKQDLIQWINDKWVYRSRDVDRPWQTEGDALTDQLTPSFIVQEPMTEKGDSNAAFHLDGRVAMGLVEIKVEVMWGLVYVMQMDATTIFLRTGEIENYGSFVRSILHIPGKAGERTAWIRDGGYLDCVIETAERVARIARIEYVRVDIFLDRSDPKACVVNEISLSTGYAYYGHEQFMAKLWAGPLHNKVYKVFNSTTPVYELTEDMRDGANTE